MNLFVDKLQIDLYYTRNKQNSNQLELKFPNNWPEERTLRQHKIHNKVYLTYSLRLHNHE